MATEIEAKIPDITNLANKAAVSANPTEMENKIPETTGVIAIPDFNEIMQEAAKNLATKSQVDTLHDSVDKDREKFFQMIDLIYFIDKSCFGLSRS